MIPLFHPPAQNLERMMTELHETLRGRWWGQGPKVEKFEKAFGERFAHRYPVMTNSCTAALHLAYALSGVRKGTEVIIPVLTCTATSHPALLLGAEIVFADIRPDTLTIDPEDAIAKISNRTRAIVIVHLGGLIVHEDLIRLREICDRRGIRLIADAAQSLGMTGGKSKKRSADFTCYSFQAIKHLSTGDGGMICCRNAEEAHKAKRLRWFDIDRDAKIQKGWQAWDRRGITFDQESPGYKYQPNDIAAAIGLAALPDFNRNLAHRQRLAALYRKVLGGLSSVSLLSRGDQDLAWLFMVLVNEDRNAFADFLKKHEIETNVAHVRNDAFSLFAPRQRLKGMDSVEKKYLCLPINTKVTDADVRFVCNRIFDYERGIR